MANSKEKQAEDKAARVKKTNIEIKTEWCKGCAICVEFCPHEVLAMKDGKAVVINPEACNACGLCEIRCPDFAIVLKIEEP